MARQLAVVLDIKYGPKAKVFETFWWLTLVVFVVILAQVFIKIGAAPLSKIMHTYDVPSSAPGTLTSDQFGFYHWMVVLVIIFDVLVCLFTFGFLVIPWNKALIWLTLVFTILAAIMNFIACIKFGITGENANKDNRNPASSYTYCAAYAVPSNTILTPPTCPTPQASYSITVLPAGLGWNPVFATTLGMAIAALIEEVLLVVFVGTMLRYFDLTWIAGNAYVLDDSPIPESSEPQPVIKLEDTKEPDVEATEEVQPPGITISTPESPGTQTNGTIFQRRIVTGLTGRPWMRSLGKKL